MTAREIGAPVRRALVGLAVAVVSIASALADAPTVLRGQVVCSNCWYDEDRTRVPYGDADDLECFERCRSHDIPPALALSDGDDATLVELRAGALELPDGWRRYLARHVEVIGTLDGPDDQPRLTVDHLSEIEPPAPASAGDASAPALRLTDLDGAERSLAALGGGAVVVNFWATWCLPCVREMPILERLRSELGPHGVRFVAAAVHDADERDRVAEFVRRHAIELPIWIGATEEHLAAFQLGRSLPGTVIVDADGRIVERIVGEVDELVLRRRLRALVADSELRF